MYPLHHERFAHLIKFGTNENPLAVFGEQPDLSALAAAADNW
jgi:hypothetical protein